MDASQILKILNTPKQIQKIQHLTHIDLEGQNIKKLPPTIGLLKNLISLNLENTDLKTLPPEISQLKKLEELYISSEWGKTNKFFHLPASIIGLKNLLVLHLSNRQLLEFPVEISKLKKLRELYIDGTGLSTLPSAIGNLKNLIILDVSYCKLKTLPPEIGKLINLSYLFAANNEIAALPKTIGDLASLTLLDLRRCSLQYLPREIGQLEQLQDLLLENNQLRELPIEIGELSNLEQLSLVNNKLTALPDTISNNSRLIPPKLSENSFAHITDEVLVAYQNEIELDLSNNKIVQIPEQIFELEKLETLSLHNNNIVRLPPQIGQLKNLKTLHLHNNQITEIPPEIGQLSKLKTLYLANNKISFLPSQIGDLKELHCLDLHKNKIKKLPPQFASLNLKILNLTKNPLTRLPEELAKIVHLDVLRINHKLLPVPTHKTQHKAFKTINEFFMYRGFGEEIVPQKNPLNDWKTIYISVWAEEAFHCSFAIRCMVTRLKKWGVQWKLRIIDQFRYSWESQIVEEAMTNIFLFSNKESLQALENLDQCLIYWCQIDRQNINIYRKENLTQKMTVKNFAQLAEILEDDCKKLLSSQFQYHIESLVKDYEQCPWKTEENLHQLSLFFLNNHMLNREKPLNRIRGYIAADTTDALIVSGKTEIGKSAVLAKIYREFTDREDMIVAYHNCGVSPLSSNLAYILRRLAGLINPLYQKRQNFLSKPKMAKACQRFRETVYWQEQKTVIIIDGLERIDIDSWDWLGNKTAKVKIILGISTENLSLLPKKQKFEHCTVPILQKKEVRQFLHQVGFAKLENEEAKLLWKNPYIFYPSYLLWAFEKYRFERSHLSFACFALNIAIDLNAPCVDLLEQLEENLDREIVCSLLSLIRCSRFGLSLAQLRELLLEIDNEQIYPLILDVLGKYIFFYESKLKLHITLSKVVDKKYLIKEENVWHRYLAEYYYNQPLYLKGTKKANIDKLRELIWQQFSAGMLNELGQTLTDKKFIECKLIQGFCAELLAEYQFSLPAFPKDLPIVDKIQLYYEQVIHWQPGVEIVLE